MKVVYRMLVEGEVGVINYSYFAMCWKFSWCQIGKSEKEDHSSEAVDSIAVHRSKLRGFP